MSASGLFSGAEAALAEAVLEALRSDADVQAVLGNPARLFDDETRGSAFPYAVLERHEQFSADASLVAGAEHRLSFATYSRYGGRIEAKQVLGALRAATDRMDLSLSGQRVVLAHVVYCDAMRTRNRQSFRGVLRVRVITEAI